jgi:protein-tyrosine phosphatase
VTFSAADRLIDLEAVHNFRDLGGYPTTDGRETRWRTLFRADGLYRLTHHDIETLRPLGLRTVLDLRTEGEHDQRGRFPVEAHEVHWQRLSLMKKTWDVADAPDDATDPAHFLAEKSVEMLDQSPEVILEVLRILTGPDALPAVFHCAAGKDRTGVIAMVVLSLLGVADETIGSDYQLSEEAMTRISAWFRVHDPGYRLTVMENPPRAFMAAPAEVPHLVLAEIRHRHGSMAGYVRDMGGDDTLIAQLRARLLT